MYCKTCHHEVPIRLGWNVNSDGSRHLGAWCCTCDRWLTWVPQTPESLRRLERQGRRPPPVSARCTQSLLWSEPPVEAGPSPGLPADRNRLPPSWSELARREPRLLDLLALARNHPLARDRRYCADEVWYGRCGQPGLKARLLELVGWSRPGDRVLGTSAAYEVAGWIIYGMLPCCSGRCGCEWLRWFRRNRDARAASGL